MTGRDNTDPGNRATGPAGVNMNDEEPPLDPAVERVRRKLVRLLIGSFGIMILGLIAVFSTIVYRLSDDTAPPADQAGTLPAIVNVSLPKGAEILSTSISGPRTLLHIEVPDGVSGKVEGQLIVLDTDSGEVVGRFRLQEISGNGSQ